MTFKTFRDSKNAESTSGCNQAILFLTDGQMQDREDLLFELLSNEAGKYTNNGRKPPVLLLTALGQEQTIACEYDGVWSKVKDGGDLAQSMGAYYKYFANAGLSEDDFVAWVAPYEYSTTGELGTTASAPVYDRSVDPPILAGVVGLDFSFVAMERKWTIYY